MARVHGRARPAQAPIGDPLAALAARTGRPLHVGILSDFVHPVYANGAVFQTRLLTRELRRRGHRVTVVGPADPSAPPHADEQTLTTVGLPSWPFRSYPGLRVPLPLAPWIFDPARWDFDICLAQTTSFLAELGAWLRRVKAIPLLCVNTTHLAATYDCLLSDQASAVATAHGAARIVERRFGRLYADLYNRSDGLIVLSEGLARYWRQRGVRVPMHVIPRAVEPELFDAPLGEDPLAGVGRPRLLCAGRMTREKGQDRLIRIFARHILPRRPEARLVFVGDGPELASYRRSAARLGAAERCIFTGEVPFTAMPRYYAHADVFVHTSLSETFGNVLSEALWSGRPVVAFDDGMGAASQIQDGVNGVLLAPGKPGAAASADAADRAFAAAVTRLIEDPAERARLGRTAAELQRERCAPAAVMRRIGRAFFDADARAQRGAPSPLPAWLEALPSVGRWTAAHAAVLAAGWLRPVKQAFHVSRHPGIGA